LYPYYTGLEKTRFFGKVFFRFLGFKFFKHRKEKNTRECATTKIFLDFSAQGRPSTIRTGRTSGLQYTYIMLSRRRDVNTLKPRLKYDIKYDMIGLICSKLYNKF